MEKKPLPPELAGLPFGSKECLKKITELEEMEVQTNLKKRNTLAIDSKQMIIIKAFASSYKMSMNNVITNLIWKGIIYYDDERRQKGLPSVVDMATSYDVKLQEKQLKAIKKQLNSEKREAINFIWGIK